MLTLIVCIVALPKFNEASMSKTEAIATMLCVDYKDGMIEAAVLILTPSQNRNSNEQVYTGQGENLGTAIESISLSIGKEIGFAQCDIMAVGEGLSEKGVMSVLDYLTRTKKVGRNAILINFTGDTEDFANAVSSLNSKKNLKLSEIIDFDSRFILSKESNIEVFYKGYYGHLGLGIVPKIQLLESDDIKTITVASGNDEETGDGQNAEDSNKKYILNDGSMIVFKNGKKYIDLPAEIVNKANLFVDNNDKRSLVVENVKDDKIDYAKVVCQVINKKSDFKAQFKNGKPVYTVKIEIEINVDEVDDDFPQKNMLNRNQRFISPTLVKRIKETVSTDIDDLFEFCKENDVDLLEIYKNFYRYKNKQWEKFMKNHTKENYLDDIELKVEVEVKSET